MLENRTDAGQRPGEQGGQFDRLRERLMILQQQMKAEKLPVMVVFEGWGGSGKGVMIANLIASLDPRGFRVYTTGAPSDLDKRYPMMRRYQLKVPEYGQMAIFDRSWYREVSTERVEGGVSGGELEKRFEQIVDFERELTDDGYVLIKFFLQISKKEQKKRFKQLEEQKATRWRVTEQDWKRHKLYEEYYEVFDQMMERTQTPNAPWIVLEAADRKEAIHQMYKIVIRRIERALEQKREAKAAPAAPVGPVRTTPEIRPMPIPLLQDVNLDLRLDAKDYRKELKECQGRLFELHNKLYRRKIPMILAYEGWDAAGKGGNIKRMTRALDPRGYDVLPIAAPSSEEKNHPFLWRFWSRLPKDGHIAVFDRTWYGRVMVERIEGFCTPAEWSRAYDEINRFERQLSDWGAIILKFWLQIDQDTQLKRFNDRQSNPDKRWKITEEDWRNREKWPQYEECVNQMLQLTNTSYAPWVIVESNDKYYARIKALREAIALLERRL